MGAAPSDSFICCCLHLAMLRTPHTTVEERFHLKQAMSVQYRSVMFATVDVDNARELAQTYHIKAVPTFQMFKQTKKIFELCGADAKKLEEKIREFINYLNLPFGTQERAWRVNEAYFLQTRNRGHRNVFVPRSPMGSCSVSSPLHPSLHLTFATILSDSATARPEASLELFSHL
ncbi:unnamed protein product [Rangifer tarandus platyrhynchus]|uniref:Thioredoxin domain-containing protein n=1 Tax=Rangifer tarandus platyrhynchus TaxID=3082113 RepID=A0ABN8ZFG7_RANTA|nr:unnamed protein product [Rangifer tarandus platyrhynchus]